MPPKDRRGEAGGKDCVNCVTVVASQKIDTALSRQAREGPTMPGWSSAARVPRVSNGKSPHVGRYSYGCLGLVHAATNVPRGTDAGFGDI
jgi:hypothetical protein